MGKHSLKNLLKEVTFPQELMNLNVLLVAKESLTDDFLIHGLKCSDKTPAYIKKYVPLYSSFFKDESLLNFESISLKTFLENESKYCPNCIFYASFTYANIRLGSPYIVEMFSAITNASKFKDTENLNHFKALDNLVNLPFPENLNYFKSDLVTKILNNVFTFSEEIESLNENDFKKVLATEIINELPYRVKEETVKSEPILIDGRPQKSINNLQHVQGYVIFDNSEVVYTSFSRAQGDNVSVLKRVLLNPMFTFNDKFCVLPYLDFKFLDLHHKVKNYFDTKSVFVETLPDESVMETFQSLLNSNTFNSYEEAFEVAVSV